MKESEFIKWQAYRTQGRAKFILMRGIVFWGLPMFLVMTFVVNRRFMETFSWAALSVHLAIWTIAGIVFGIIVWKVNEKRYVSELNRRYPPAAQLKKPLN